MARSVGSYPQSPKDGSSLHTEDGVEESIGFPGISRFPTSQGGGGFWEIITGAGSIPGPGTNND